MLGASSLRLLSRMETSRVSIAHVKIEQIFAQHPLCSRLPSLRASFISSRRISSTVSKASGKTDITNDMSHLERLKDLWRKYGVVAIGTYVTLYGAVLGSTYVAIDQGWVRTSKKTSQNGDSQPDDSLNLVTTTNKLVKIAEDLGIAQYLEVERVNAKSGTFLLAWIATKFTEPLRLALTIAVTPRIARFLGRAPKLPPRDTINKKQQPTPSKATEDRK